MDTPSTAVLCSYLALESLGKNTVFSDARATTGENSIRRRSVTF
jgi:hypothetical protein